MVSTALALSMLLAACSGGGASGETSGAGEGNGGTSSASPERQENLDPLGKYDPPITVRAVRRVDQSTKYKDGESVENNVWIRGYEEQLGIKIVNDWVVVGSGDQYNQKLNVSLASGDLPDIFSVNAQQLKQLVEAGQIEDLTEVYEKYASDYTKDVMTQSGPNILNSATFDGKLMAIPVTAGTIDGLPLLWIRTDWLQKLNLPEPKTMDDVIAIARAFATKDPDGNGKDDTIGMAASKDLYGGFPGLDGFFNAYHAYPSTGKMWIKGEDGQIVNGAIQPEVKTALAKLQELYKEGILDKEFGSKDGGKVAEAATSGKLGLYFGQMWTPIWPLQDGKNKDAAMDWKPFPIPSADGQPVKLQANFPVNDYWVVRKGFEHPEAMVKLQNFTLMKLWSPDQDPEFFEPRDGIEVHKYAINEAHPARKNIDNYLATTEALRNNDPSGLSVETKSLYEKILKYRSGDNTHWAMEKVFGEGGSFAVINDHYVSQNVTLDTAFYGAPTETMGAKMETLSRLELETFTKIIMGAASVDEFDQFVENWKKLGGDQITKEVNDWAANR